MIIGKGHPDDLKENGTHAGVAPLEGTITVGRLMYSDAKSKQNANALDRNLLVKKEWDAAEIWLNLNIDN